MRHLFLMLFLAILGVVEKPAALDSYVLRLGDSTTMNGSFRHRAIGRMEERYGKRFFWFERDDEAYVVTDPKVIERAREIVAPQQDLGAKQAALGERQAALGGKQAALGVRQAAARHNAERQEMLSREQEALARQQEALGQEQEALGREQERLGEEIDRRLTDLADHCIDNGLAKKIAG